jgi:hypothetical protein
VYPARRPTEAQARQRPRFRGDLPSRLTIPAPEVAHSKAARGSAFDDPAPRPRRHRWAARCQPPGGYILAYGAGPYAPISLPRTSASCSATSS